jgi:hippurate hydrolase
MTPPVGWKIGFVLGEVNVSLSRGASNNMRLPARGERSGAGCLACPAIWYSGPELERSAAMKDKYCTLEDVAPEGAELAEIRRHIHAHPELSHKEVETARLVADKLKGWGYEVAEGVGGTGVVGRLQLGSGKQRLGIRADMDALPIVEETGLAYASRNEGVMHACGHDGHTTVLLGAAKQIAARSKFSGTLNLIFQPAEEAGIDCGAKRMLKDGLFERFPAMRSSGCTISPERPKRLSTSARDR